MLDITCSIEGCHSKRLSWTDVCPKHAKKRRADQDKSGKKSETVLYPTTMVTVECRDCKASMTVRKYSGRKLCDACRNISAHKIRVPLERILDENRYLDSNGYVMMDTPTGRVAEHRFVMEQILERPLKKGENVHHINGLRHDNNPRNLELWVSPQPYGQRASDIDCPHCGKVYMTKDELRRLLKNYAQRAKKSA